MEKSIYTSRLKALGYLVIGLIFIILILMMFITDGVPDDMFIRFILVAGIVFLGLLCFVNFYHVFIRENVCKLTESGIEINKARFGFSWKSDSLLVPWDKISFIPWKDIYDITIYSDKNLILSVSVNDAEKYGFETLTLSNVLCGISNQQKKVLETVLKKWKYNVNNE